MSEIAKKIVCMISTDASNLSEAYSLYNSSLEKDILSELCVLYPDIVDCSVLDLKGLQLCIHSQDEIFDNAVMKEGTRTYSGVYIELGVAQNTVTIDLSDPTFAFVQVLHFLKGNCWDSEGVGFSRFIDSDNLKEFHAFLFDTNIQKIRSVKSDILNHTISVSKENEAFTYQYTNNLASSLEYISINETEIFDGIVPILHFLCMRHVNVRFEDVSPYVIKKTFIANEEEVVREFLN